MHITKTDYLEYTFCKKNLWLKKHKPELFEDVELSEFEKKIIEEGNLADEAARNLFPDGELIGIVGVNAIPVTKKILEKNPPVLFQGAFSFNDFFVQADILRYNDILKGWELYEVKATNDVKREIPHHHINDLAFQKIVIKNNGIKIVKADVIHLNGEYRMNKKVNYNELFTIVELTDEVLEAEDGVRDQMNDLKTYLGMNEERGCECLYRGRNAQCTTFQYSNPDVPEYSVHDINRIGASKKLFYDWIDRGIYAIEDIDNPQVLTGAKQAQHEACSLGKPVIDEVAIKAALDKLVFPLQFFDYEAFVCAIPMFDGFGPYEHTPFQYSLHIMQADGRIEHKEFLITDTKGDLTRPLVERMKQDIDPRGTVIAWYSIYERDRNTKLAELHPDYAKFLGDINDGMFDLKTIFSENLYVDSAFKGSASIKRVLPVIVPELTYKSLNISKGDQASERWERMISEDTSEGEKRQIERDLLEYCGMDTWAMVRIWEVLKKIN